jgi:methionyl-tRNA formyltransferase
MRVALACAGRRGHRLLERLIELAPEAQLLVFSFREEPFEPPFFDDIRALAEARGAAFVETRKVDGSRAAAAWDAAEVHLMLVVGWRYLIGPRAYDRPRRGTYVFHDSLLPRYRGFSPTVWAICNGERETGVTLFRIAPEVDAGEVVDQRAVPIGPDDAIGDVQDRVTEAYLHVLDANLTSLLQGTALLRPQDHAAATYVPKRSEADYRIDWSRSARAIHDLVRAVTAPYPGAFTEYAGERLRVWRARELPESGGPPGAILAVIPGGGVAIGAGSGAVLLQEVQWQGGPRQPAAIALCGARGRLGS